MTLPGVLHDNQVLIKAFQKDCQDACRVLLDSLCSSVDAETSSTIKEANRQHKASESGLKLIYEPTKPAKKDVQDNIHTDGGTFTLLFYNEEGLHVHLSKEDKWGFVTPRAGCAVVNVADSLASASKQRFHSPTHRVTQFEDGFLKRTYLSYYLRPNNEYIAQIRCN